jgi:hypothetical protein
MQYFYKSLYHLANRRGFGNTTRLKPLFIIEVVALLVRLDSHLVFGEVCVAHVFSFLKLSGDNNNVVVIFEYLTNGVKPSNKAFKFMYLIIFLNIKSQLSN